MTIDPIKAAYSCIVSMMLFTIFAYLKTETSLPYIGDGMAGARTSSAESPRTIKIIRHREWRVVRNGKNYSHVEVYLMNIADEPHEHVQVKVIWMDEDDEPIRVGYLVENRVPPCNTRTLKIEAADLIGAERYRVFVDHVTY